MQIKLYYTASENNQLVKSLSLVNNLTGSLRDASNVIRPSVLVEAASIGDANYAYIQQFNRYYYIKEVTSVRNNLWQLLLEVDVLMSFKQDIKNLQVILEETEVVSPDNYLADDRVWIAKVKDKTSIVQFPYGLSSDGDYILITAGGTYV